MQLRAALLLLLPLVPGPVAAQEAVTIRATRTETPLRIDGKLDEPFYTATEPFSDFIQTDPVVGAPPSERTELWVAFDAKNVYVSVRCWESHPERLVANELRRDSNLIATANDNVGWGFDTYLDRKSSLVFDVNANGGRADGQVANERRYSGDWNPIWEVRTGRFEDGWTLEAAVPFSSLRYPPGTKQTWGFTVKRLSRWRNEIMQANRVPNGSQIMGLLLASFYATLEGIEAPPARQQLELKPYVLGQAARDPVGTQGGGDRLKGQAGLDVKYGVARNVTVDFTANTDFAQVEADEQQINLTRFSLFFPEKRDFFLENQGTFTFGRGTNVGVSDVPTLFYSRRIGLEAGQLVPLRAGGRLTGRVGRYELGFVNIHTSDESISRSQPTAFTVARLKRDLFRKSSIGALLTHRSEAPGRESGSGTYGVDGTFAFGDYLTMATYWARTNTPGRPTQDVSYRGAVDYNADRYGAAAEHLVIEPDFNPEIGFVRRSNMRKSYGFLRFSPRPTKSVVRKYSSSGDYTYIENAAGRVETRQGNADFSVELQNSDKFLLGATTYYEFLPAPFRIAPNVAIPAGGHEFSSLRAGINFGQQRKVFGNVALESGSFYDGRTTSIAFRSGRAEINTRLSIEPSLSVNRIDVSGGSFVTRLVGSRVTFTMTPLMFTSALIQYNSSTNSVSTNARLRWEYQPGSELFIVYNEQRDTRSASFPALANRAFIVKINRLLRP